MWLLGQLVEAIDGRLDDSRNCVLALMIKTISGPHRESHVDVVNRFMEMVRGGSAETIREIKALLVSMPEESDENMSGSNFDVTMASSSGSNSDTPMAFPSESNSDTPMSTSSGAYSDVPMSTSSECYSDVTITFPSESNSDVTISGRRSGTESLIKGATQRE